MESIYTISSGDDDELPIFYQARAPIEFIKEAKLPAPLSVTWVQPPAPAAGYATGTGGRIEAIKRPADTTTNETGSDGEFEEDGWEFDGSDDGE